MNIVLGEYIKKESILHQLDPRTKIIGSFSLILSFLFVNTLIGYVITGILALILIFLSKIPLKEFLKSLKYLLYILIFSSIFHILSNQDGKLLLQLGKFSIYDSGVFSAMKMIFRIVFLLIFSSLLTLTTKPLDIALGLETLLSPLKKIGLPIQDFSIMISITLRFIPTILQEANTIKMAQQARGENFEGRNPFKKLYQYSLILLPLLISVIQKVENLTLAMEARAYHCGLERTNFYKLEFQKRDYIAIIVILISSLLIFLGNKNIY
ncbi:energy-coupling factor transporter transmembrane component T [Fusobacterium simiae]|uniref:energy-coupling factor transporter transmembrane component T family protein n=1 Tax=Fusobacterium TaxID=848 RepID=UPI0003F54567|nr:MULTISPECIES: energy-coupling factor transporter transmembrane component T [Fusobacterium]MDC7954234.1 energy-coupling factor transporter transmembrane component T [Fusobacterium simiae]